MAIPLFFVSSASRVAMRAAIGMAGMRGVGGGIARELLRQFPDAFLGLTGKASFKWHGSEFNRSITNTMRRRLDIASEKMHQHIYLRLSVPVEYTGSHVIRSKPGQYPRMETDKLRSDLFREFTDELSVIIGTRVDYGMILELRMRRSFLRRGFHEVWPRARQILLNGPPPLEDNAFVGPIGVSSRTYQRSSRSKAKSTIKKAKSSARRANARRTRAKKVKIKKVLTKVRRRRSRRSP